MSYLYLKALHFLFIITWFAGLFYVVRLFIYQTEANDKDEPDRSILIEEYKRNTQRLWYIITWPSAIITLIVGSSLLFIHRMEFLTQDFMNIKLAFVFVLYIYQFICHHIYKLLQNDKYNYISMHLRIWNEVSTLLLVGTIFIIVLKSTLSLVWGFIGLVLLSVVMMVAIKLYKNYRNKHES